MGLVVLAGLSAPTRSVAATVEVGHLSPPTAVGQALDILADAVERGDRRALVELAPPARRGAAGLLADGLATGTASDLRLRLLALSVEGGTARGHGLLSATGWSSPLSFVATADAGSSLESPEAPARLEIGALLPAEVAMASLELTWDDEARRLAGRGTLELVAMADGVRTALLTVPAMTSACFLGPTALEPIDAGDDSATRHVLVGLDGELDEGERTTLVLDWELVLPRDQEQPETTVAWLSQADFAPWAAGGHFELVLVADVPESLRAVSVGPAEELPAAPGRRRTRLAAGRPIDYACLLVGPYRRHADTTGRLELWRTRDVGGDPKEILATLEALVGFFEDRIAPLPYRRFRLVELPSARGLAVSYASGILMAPDLLATTRRRRSVLSHEVAHQWWGNAVQGDERTRWISEGMAEACRDLFLRATEGEATWRDRREAHRRRALEALGLGQRPLADAPGEGAHVYDRGALAVLALHDVIGEATFWAVLRRWVAEMAERRVGTDELQASAEAEAGRDLSTIFDPWFRSTAWPVLGLEWEARGDAIACRVTQQEPAFELPVPLRVTWQDGSTSTHRVVARGVVTDTRIPALDAATDVTLDPDGLTPAVRPGERARYLLGEARACLARGERERGIALLIPEDGSLPADEADVVLLAAALAAEGRSAEAASVRRRLAAARPSAAARHRASLALVDRLLEASAAEAAVPILDELSSQVRDGAAVPLRRAAAARQLGREAEARAFLDVALRARPDSPAVRQAVRRPLAETGDQDAGLVRVLPDDRWETRRTSSADTVALALGRGRVAILQRSARRLLTGSPGDLLPVVGFAPAAAVGAAAGETDGTAWVVVVESSRWRSSLSVIALDTEGRGRLRARHLRGPGGVLSVVAAGDTVALALPDAGAIAWHALAVPLLLDSEGPDDRDGLLRLRVHDDARFARLATTPTTTAAFLTSRVVAVDPEGRLVDPDGDRPAPDGGGVEADDASSEGRATRTGRGERIRHVTTAGGDVALVVVGDRSTSPFPEDALPYALLRRQAEEVPLPLGVERVSTAADGGFVVVADGDAGPRVLAGRFSRAR